MKFDLYKGKTGVALFFHYYGKTYHHAASHKLAEKLIKEAVEESLRHETDLSLYAGIPGVLWGARKILGSDKEINKLVPKGFRQRLLLEMAHALRYAGFHELSHGASGWWVFSESVPSSRWFREVVLEYLRKTRNFEKNHWWTASGVIGIGMAHGICAPLLIRKKASDVRRLKSFLKPLLRGPLPPLYPKSLKESPVQSAWCYGDAGAGLAFTRLARETGDRALEKTAKEIFRRGILPSPGYCKITDPFICHGFSGQALLALRFWKMTKEKRDLDPVNYWGKKLVSMSPRDFRKIETVGLHDGLSGVGLVIMALIHEKPESWDRLLLLS